MSSEAGKPTGHNKQLDREFRDMVTSITNRVTDLHKSHSGHRHVNEDEHGVNIITLAGNNSGATLRRELDDDHQDNPRKRGGGHHGLQHGGPNGDPDGMNTYVNSNFQAVNNSVIMGGSYTTNDPGVHLDIKDFYEPHGHCKQEKKGWKGEGKEKEKEGFQNDQHEEQHDEHHDLLDAISR